jgi:hypothetical protein
VRHRVSKNSSKGHPVHFAVSLRGILTHSYLSKDSSLALLVLNDKRYFIDSLGARCAPLCYKKVMRKLMWLFDAAVGVNKTSA